MITVEFFIPLADNDGVAFTGEIVNAWRGVLTDLFGGFSELPGTVVGAWKDGDRVYRDDLAVFMVAVPSIADGGKVGEAGEVARRIFRQEAIFIRYLGLAEILG